MTHLQLFEAFSLSLAKELTKPWKDSPAERRYDKLFGKGTFRLYLPLVEPQVKKPVVSSTMLKVTEVLDGNGYVVLDYLAGTATKFNDTKNVFKIGKLLQRLNPEVKLEFDSDMVRDGATAKAEDLLICISRHPYDIGGASTGRGWTSCMNLHGELTQKSIIPKDILYGSLVAYLIKKTDKNIKRPLGRILIKPHVDANGIDKKKPLYPEAKIYGVNYPGFRSSIIGWCHTVTPINSDGKDIFRYRPRKELYDDRERHNHSGIAPLTSLGMEIVNTHLAPGFVSVKHPDSDGVGIYDRTAKKLIIEPDYKSIICLDETLFACLKDGLGYLIFDRAGHRINQEVYARVDEYGIRHEQYLYFAGIVMDESLTGLYSYQIDMQECKRVAEADLISSLRKAQWEPYVTLFELDGSLSLYEFNTRKVLKTPLKGHGTPSFVSGRVYHSGTQEVHHLSTLAGDEHGNWYNIDTRKTEPLLQGYEAEHGFGSIIPFKKNNLDLIYSLITNRVIGNPVRDTYAKIVHATGVYILTYKHIGMSTKGACNIYNERGDLLVKNVKTRLEVKSSSEDDVLHVQVNGRWGTMVGAAVEFAD